MKGGLLQKLLNKQKHAKFGDDVVNERWEDLRQKIVSGSSKFEDTLPPLTENGKMLPFTIYMCSIEPDTHNIRIITQLLTHLDVADFEALIPLLRDMVLSCGQYQISVIEMIVRAFFISDSLAFAEILVAIIQAAPSIHSIVSNAMIRFFPQTSFPLEQQLRYMRSILAVCSKSTEATTAALGRIFQHLVALDCELVTDNKTDGSCIVDDDVALKFSPQMELFVEFVKNSSADIFHLLLQLFDLYLIDLPKTAAIQFVFFYVASFSHENAETFIGFLLAKLFDVNSSQRTRANAALYIASFVVRANYIDDEFACVIVDYVADFANKYAEHMRSEAPDTFKLNINIHSVFYYSVQCIIYIFCWRWRNWKSGGFDPNKRWNLRSLVSNGLKAVNAVDKNTVEMFRSLGVVPVPGDTISIERISVWFPFDPCVLEEVEQLVAPLFVQWTEDEPDDPDTILNRQLAKICERRLISIQTFGRK